MTATAHLTAFSKPFFVSVDFTSIVDQAKWNAIIQACNEIAIKAFKKPMRDLDPAVYKLPFHCGEEKEYAGYGRGVVYFTM